MHELPNGPRSRVQIHHTETRKFKSDASGCEYTVRVALPLQETAEQYPAIYLHGFAGSDGFALVTSLLRLLLLDGEMPQVLVIGVTPHLSPTELAQLRRLDVPGEADGPRRLLSGLVEDVLPFIARNYPEHPSKRVLVGHSWSGMLALHALAEGANEFAGYLASSPALWRLAGQLFAFEERIAARKTPPAGKVFLSAGALEQPNDRSLGDRFNERSELFQNLDRLRWLARAMGRRNYPELTLQTRIFADETHTAVFPVAVSHGLRWMIGRRLEQAARDWPPLPDQVRSLLQSARVPSSQDE